MKRELPRIYVDFNTAMQDPEARVWLPVDALGGAHDQIAAGARVLLHDEELEVEAVVERLDDGDWWARPDPATYRALDLVAPAALSSLD